MKTFLIQLLIYASIYDFLNIPKRILDKLQAHAELSAFQYENKESWESNNHTKKMN